MTTGHTQKNVAVFFGGCSSEYGVSLTSASAVIRNLDPAKYRPILIGISRDGDWFHYTGSVSDIADDRWQNSGHCVPAAFSPSRSHPGLLCFASDIPTFLPIDVALPILHGRNGEDGTLQGMLELAGIPLAGCSVLASAVCMDKDRAHRLAAAAGVSVPQSLTLKSPGRDTQDLTPLLRVIREFVSHTGYPLFVKPVKAGSSYGISKVETEAALEGALKEAFRYDDEAIVEEFVEGPEMGCAVLGGDDPFCGIIDEIELSSGFFDFTEKYTLKTSSIHVPARVSEKTAEELKETAKRIYRALGCSGFARVDMFLTPTGRIVFNEVNTIPGFTEHSRYPGMMQAAGLSFSEMLDKIIEQAVTA